MGVLIKLGYQNLGRHRRRTFLTISAIFLAVGLVTYIQCHLKGIVDTMVDDFIRLHTGHVKIIHTEYQLKERLLPLNLNVTEVDKRISEIQEIPAVADLAPRLRFGALLNVEENNQTGMGIGLIPDKEKNMMDIEKDIKPGGSLPPGGIVVGQILAERLGVKMGEEVTLLSQTQYHSIAAGNFTVTGILDSGFEYIDAAMFYINLDEAQEMLDMENQVSELVVMGETREETAALVEAITPLLANTDLTTLTWLKQGGMGQMIKSSEAGIWVVVVIVLFLAALTIANTMLMSVMERTREIGTL